jgi:hypothetical protein
MAEDDRNRRPVPERLGPNRDPFSAAGPPPSAGGGGPAGGGQAAHPTVDEVVAQAVRAGYQVIEDNIKQGCVAAQRIRRNDYQVSDIPDDATRATKRLLQLTRELSTTWFDLIAAAMRDPALQNAFACKPEDAERNGREGHTGGTPPPPAVLVGCSVRPSKRQVVVMPLTLQSLGGPAVPTIGGLHSPDPALPPIRNAVFRRAADGSGPLVEIHVPADHPPGIYHGVVVDGDSQRPLGTLTVTVLP